MYLSYLGDALLIFSITLVIIGLVWMYLVITNNI